MKTDLENKLRAQISRSNKRFAKATKVQQRLMIAKDALKQLKCGRFFAACGTYFEAPADAHCTVDLQTHLLTKDVTCRVCAKGAMFASKAICGNEVKLTAASYGFDAQEETCVAELGCFSTSQLSRIEIFFEGWAGDAGYLKNKCRKFYGKYPDNAVRMAAIMKNIIANKGTFKP